MQQGQHDKEERRKLEKIRHFLYEENIVGALDALSELDESHEKEGMYLIAEHHLTLAEDSPSELGSLENLIRGYEYAEETEDIDLINSYQEYAEELRDSILRNFAAFRHDNDLYPIITKKEMELDLDSGTLPDEAPGSDDLAYATYYLANLSDLYDLAELAPFDVYQAFLDSQDATIDLVLQEMRMDSTVYFAEPIREREYIARYLIGNDENKADDLIDTMEECYRRIEHGVEELISTKHEIPGYEEKVLKEFTETYGFASAYEKHKERIPALLHGTE